MTVKKTENFKEAEQWGFDHGMNAKQTATMMGNIEDESTGITSQHGDKNYMQYEHGNGLTGKNMYDYIGKFENKMPKMKEYVQDYKNASLGTDETFFHKQVEVGKNGERRAELTHEMYKQVKADYKKHENKDNKTKDHHKSKHLKKHHQSEKLTMKKVKQAEKETEPTSVAGAVDEVIANQVDSNGQPIQTTTTLGDVTTTSYANSASTTSASNIQVGGVTNDKQPTSQGSSVDGSFKPGYQQGQLGQLGQLPTLQSQGSNNSLVASDASQQIVANGSQYIPKAKSKQNGLKDSKNIQETLINSRGRSQNETLKKYSHDMGKVATHAEHVLSLKQQPIKQTESESNLER